MSDPIESSSTPPRPGRADLLLAAITVALLVIGTLMVYSASFVIAHNEFKDDLYFLKGQLLSIAIGGVGLVAAARIDYRRWRRLSLLLLAGTIAALVLVLVPGIGTQSYGSTRWLGFGPVSFQPSEIAKLALTVYLADWLARRGQLIQKFGKGLLPFAIIVIIVAALVELQPDLGTTFVIVGTAACVFFVAGAKLVHVGAIGISGTLGGVLLIARMSGYRQDRIAAFLDPWSNIQSTGWHTAQTLIALGSGGLTGMGLGDSRQKFYWVPNAHTDAIFAIIGEEMGFIGTFGVLALFVLLAWRGFRTAWGAPDAFGRYLAAGITCTIAIQALVNIAVVTNSIPFTGVTLPLVSFGRTSTVVKMVSIGLLLSISRYRGEPTVHEPAAEKDAAARMLAAQRSRGGWRVTAAPGGGPTPRTSGSRLAWPGGTATPPIGAQARPVRRRAHVRTTSATRRRHGWGLGG